MKVFRAVCLRFLKTCPIQSTTRTPIQLCLGESSPYRPEGRWNTKDSILAHCQTILKRTNQTDRKPTGNRPETDRKRGRFFLFIYRGHLKPFFQGSKPNRNRPFLVDRSSDPKPAIFDRPNRPQKTAKIGSYSIFGIWPLSRVNHCASGRAYQKSLSAFWGHFWASQALSDSRKWPSKQNSF